MEPTQSSPSSKLHKPAIPLENSPRTSHFYPHQSWLNSYNNPQDPPHHPAMFFSSNHSSHNFNLNQDEDEELDDQTSTDNTENPNQNPQENPLDHEREPMFEKPLTPSDVGKLNRLVIPKQHAEKYFPLGGDSGDKGLLLSFEDESGNCWRFRYSYWNSSQSYVLTKGWSRYVKEKQLDAGDIILFERYRTDGDRLFIGWRKRGAAVAVAAAAADGGNAAIGNNSGGGGGNEGWSTWGLYQGHPYLGHIQGHGANVPCQPDSRHAGSMVQNQEPAGNPKRLLRLFGVNLECQLDVSKPSTPDSSSVSSQGPTNNQFYSQSYTSNYMGKRDCARGGKLEDGIESWGRVFLDRRDGGGPGKEEWGKGGDSNVNPVASLNSTDTPLLILRCVSSLLITAVNVASLLPPMSSKGQETLEFPFGKFYALSIIYNFTKQKLFHRMQ
ncbi:hypothetical protein CRYUN_Cryun05aG0215500 [Craigia yunnanensis]